MIGLAAVALVACEQSAKTEAAPVATTSSAPVQAAAPTQTAPAPPSPAPPSPAPPSPAPPSPAPPSPAPPSPAPPSPAPAAASAAAAETQPTPAKTYAVFNVKGDDVLNVRAEADGKSAKVYSYGPAVKRVKGTGRAIDKGSTRWVEVAFTGGTGWVNRAYLTEVKRGGGCDDPALTAVIRAVMRAVATKNEAAFHDLITPVRGLLVRHERWNPSVRFRGDEADGIFTSNTVKNWGTQDGSGEKLAGSFKQLVLPTLQQTLAPGSKEKCGQLLAGGSAGLNEWPSEFGALTIASFHWPGQGGGMDWQTWVAGLEYVDDKPYLATLVGYHWEI